MNATATTTTAPVSRAASRGVTVGLWLWATALLSQVLVAVAQLDGWTSREGWTTFGWWLLLPPLLAAPPAGIAALLGAARGARQARGR